MRFLKCFYYYVFTIPQNRSILDFVLLAMEHHINIRNLQYSCATVLSDLFSTYINLKDDTPRLLHVKRHTTVASITSAFQEKIFNVQLKVMHTHLDDIDLIFILLTTPSPLHMVFNDPNSMVRMSRFRLVFNKCFSLHCEFTSLTLSHT